MKKIVCIIGQTASGKSALAVELAKKFDGEIISADSRQVFCGLDLATGKILQHEMQGIPHHLIDIKKFNQSYSVAEFVRDATQKIDEIYSRNKLPIICGGTMLYSRALTQGFDVGKNSKKLAKKLEKYTKKLEKLPVDKLLKILTRRGGILVKTDEQNPRRIARKIAKVKFKICDTPNNPQFDFVQIAINYPRAEINSRIEKRLASRIEQGMITEVEAAIKNGAKQTWLKTLGLEMRETTKWLNGEYVSFDDYFNRLKFDSFHYAKRQATFLQKEQNLTYVSPSAALAEAEKIVTYFLNKKTPIN